MSFFNWGTIIFVIIMYNTFFAGDDEKDVDIVEKDGTVEIQTSESSQKKNSIKASINVIINEGKDVLKQVKEEIIDVAKEFDEENEELVVEDDVEKPKPNPPPKDKEETMIAKQEIEEPQMKSLNETPEETNGEMKKL